MKTFLNYANIQRYEKDKPEELLKLGVSEHKTVVRTFELNSKIAQHVHNHDHTFDFDNVEIVDGATFYPKRLFPEAWYSLMGNDNIDIPSTLFFL